jgi:hypothetical protein
MIVEAVREITQWKVEGAQPNHCYLVDGNKIMAYIPFGESVPHYFSTPLPFDRRGRKFEQLRPNPFKTVADSRRRVEGSRGAVYWVDDEDKTCTCPGWTFHGHCRHLAQ